MADYDVLDMTVMLRDAQRSLRKLFPDYEEKAEPCRQLLRRMMADIPTDKVLVADCCGKGSARRGTHRVSG